VPARSRFTSFVLYIINFLSEYTQRQALSFVSLRLLLLLSLFSNLILKREPAQRFILSLLNPGLLIRKQNHPDSPDCESPIQTSEDLHPSLPAEVREQGEEHGGDDHRRRAERRCRGARDGRRRRREVRGEGERAGLDDEDEREGEEGETADRGEVGLERIERTDHLLAILGGGHSPS